MVETQPEVRATPPVRRTFHAVERATVPADVLSGATADGMEAPDARSVGALDELVARIEQLSAADLLLVDQLVARLLSPPIPAQAAFDPTPAGPPSSGTDADEQDKPGRAAQFHSVAGMFSWAENYPMPRARGRVSQRGAWDLETLDGIRSFFREVLAVEAPIHEDLLMVVLERARGRGALPESILDRAQEALRQITVDGVRVRRDNLGFYLVPGRARAKVRVWHRSARFRPPKWVPPAELDLAIRRLVESAHPVGVTELAPLVRRLFAWDDDVPGVETAVAEAAARLLSAGQLAMGEQGRLQPGDPV